MHSANIHDSCLCWLSSHFLYLSHYLMQGRLILWHMPEGYYTRISIDMHSSLIWPWKWRNKDYSCISQGQWLNKTMGHVLLHSILVTSQNMILTDKTNGSDWSYKAHNWPSQVKYGMQPMICIFWVLWKNLQCANGGQLELDYDTTQQGMMFVPKWI